MAASGPPAARLRSAKPHDSECERLRAGHDGLDLEIFVRRVSPATDRTDPADGWRADARRKAGIGAASGELLAHRLSELARAGGIMGIEPFRVLARDQRLELARDREPAARAGQMPLRDDALDLRHRRIAMRRIDKAQVELRRGARRHHVDDLSARAAAHLAADPARAIGEAVQRGNLAGKLLDRAHPIGAVVAGMGRLAGHVETHEDAALAPSDDAAIRAAGLGVEHRTGAPRLLLDQASR